MLFQFLGYVVGALLLTTPSSSVTVFCTSAALCLSTVAFCDHFLPTFLPEAIEQHRTPAGAVTNKSLALTNIFVLCSFLGAAHHAFAATLPPSTDVLYHTTILPIAAFVSSGAFYYLHRLLHHPRLYKHVHRVHHLNVHTSALAAFDTHPVELVFGNVLPFVLPVILLRMSVNFGVAFGLMGLVNTFLAHANFKFRCGVVNWFLGMSDFHSKHHALINVNYGLKNGIFDRLHDTHYRY